MSSDRIYYSRDAELQAARDKTLLSLFFVVVGLSVGAVLALLFAPAAGTETRQDIADSFESGVKEGQNMVTPLIKRFEHEVTTLRDRVQDHVENA